MELDGIDKLRRYVSLLDERDETLNENKSVLKLIKDAIKIDKAEYEFWFTAEDYR